MSEPEPPKTHVISFSRSWPFVSAKMKHETRRDHAMMLTLMAFATAVILATGALPALFAVFTSFVAGYDLHSWVTYMDLYDDQDAALRDEMIGDSE